MSLASLAARYGVARSYRTDRGELVKVGRDTVVAVLAALGVDTTGRGWIARAIEEHDARRAARLVQPVLVAWDGDLAVPAATDAVLHHEDGTVEQLVPGALRRGVPPGYHELRVAAAGREERAVVISTPVRAWRPPGRGRHFGVYAPLFALHRSDRPGPGDLDDLARLLDWVVSHGGDTVLTLPLLASFLDEPMEVSPYSPVSRLMWNELYAAVERASWTESAAGQLDYAAAAAATRAAISAVADRVDEDPFAGGDLLRFLAERPDVTDYARFRAAQAAHGRNWRVWPEPLRSGTIEPADVDAGEVRYHTVAQWLTDRRLAALGQAARAGDLLLGLDLAIGTHPDGYDVWRHQGEFATAANVGAPPDTFFVAGQDWGFPPMLPEADRATGHRYFRRAIAHHLRHATMLRVDHVMGCNRLYWIPHGAPATEGTYVRYPSEELFAILVLESHRAQALVVGEDLGTVPPAVRAAMRRHGLTGTWVGQGSLEALPTQGDYPRAPARAVAALNTHDMPTFAGWVEGRDIDDREDLGQIDPATARTQHAERAAVVAAAEAHHGARGTRALLDALVADMGAGRADVVLVNLEDLWLEPLPHNVPGTSTERPNWRRPAAVAVDRLDDVDAAVATFAVLAGARDGAGRARRPS